jgi:hypothetical protein
VEKVTPFSMGGALPDERKKGRMGHGICSDREDCSEFRQVSLQYWTIIFKLSRREGPNTRELWA